MSDKGLRRREVLVAGAVGTAGLVVLAGCGSGGTGEGAADTSPSAKRAATGTSADDTGLVAVSAIPVGGAVSATSGDGEPVIVSRPEGGQVVAFSAICTHMGCTVAPDGGQLRCPCHGSVYEAATGRNVSGPAPRPLPRVAVRVVDGQVVQG